MRKKDNAVYQDGSPLAIETVRLYHITSRGPMHNILQAGIQASAPSHGIEGLWTFAISSIAGYASLAGYVWGRTGLETTYGTILELQAPKTLSDGYTGALHHNRRIAGLGENGHFR